MIPDSKKSNLTFIKLRMRTNLLLRIIKKGSINAIYRGIFGSIPF